MRIRKLSILTQDVITALGDTLDGYASYFAREIRRGTCELWSINDSESHAITRLEYDPDKKYTTLVICCYAGKNLHAFALHVLNIADKNKWLIRVHTKNRALVRWYTRRYNFNIPEYVLMRDYKDGQ